MSTRRLVAFLGALTAGSLILGLVAWTALLRPPPVAPGTGSALTVTSAEPVSDDATYPEPAASQAAADAPEPSAGQPECRRTFSMPDGPAPTLENEARLAGDIFIGAITEVHDGRWSTDDGQRPLSDVALSGEFIVTPVVVSIEAVARGNSGERVAFNVQGGKAGCDEFTPASRPTELRVGDTYAFFLIAADRTEPARRLLGMWPVVDGVVDTPLDGRLTATEFVEAVQAAEYEPPPG